MADTAPGRLLVPTGFRRHPKWKWPRGSAFVGNSEPGTDVLIDARTLSTHVHVLGASGFGKSKLLEGLARQIFLALDGARKGLILVDPHGTLVKAILCWVATHGLDKYRRVHVIDPASENVVGINPFRQRPGIDPAFAANTFCNAVMEVWGGADPTQTPQLRESLKAIFYTLTMLGWTLLECELLTDIADPLGVRQFIIERIKHPQVRRYWLNLDPMPPAKIEEKQGSAVRRLSEFTFTQALRRMFSQRDRVIDFRAAMDAGDIVLIDLSYGDGRISEDESSLLGRLMFAEIFLAVLGRAEGSTQTILMVDECQRYLTRDIASILDQARKFSLSCILSHQHVGHLREAGEHVFRSVMTNTRSKVIFGGLDDDDATLMARNILRGTLDLEMPKHIFDRPTVVGQEYDWLQNEATARGTSHAVGENQSVSEGESTERSTTQSRGTTVSESDTISSSETFSESDGTSEAHTDSLARGSSEGISHFGSNSRSQSRAQEYDQFGNWIGGPTRTSGCATSDNTGFNRSTNSQSGSADISGRSHMTGTAYGTAIAHSTGTAVTEGTAITEGTSRSAERSRGTTTADTVSHTATVGRSQTLRNVYTTLPTQAYGLEELRYLGSSLLGGLGVGEAIAKIGNEPPVRLKTLRIKPGWASDAQVERLKRRLAAKSPFVTSLAEARDRYLAHRREVMAQLLGQSAVPQLPQIIDHEETLSSVEPPPLKDEGWG